jgi:hypothetical protein
MSTDLERLDEANACHDDDPERGAALLRGIAPAQLPADRRPTLAFLFNHVFGEKLNRWDEALKHQRSLMDAAQPAPAAVLWRQAAVAARLAGPGHKARHFDAGFGAATGAEPARCDEALQLAVAMYRAPGLPAADAAELVLGALAPLDAAAWQSAGPLDATVAACANNLASSLLDRPAAELTHAAPRRALALSAQVAERFWQRAGTWVQHERALYLRAMAGNALGEPHEALAHALAALALLDAHDSAHAEDVDRAFIELESWHACTRLGRPGEADAAKARADAWAAAFGDDGLTRWFDGRVRQLQALG